ncbi:MAG: hypothetical protein M4579_005275 [Chaenotheca gracillima]|nr:MAG: hypothetical protein M4579_005275 [Chaenotheca gracillima]
MAKLSGASTVLIADIDAGRVQYATDNGFATQGLVVTRPLLNGHVTEKLECAKDIANDMIERLESEDDDIEGADVTFDCTGKEICMQAGFFTTRPGGKMVMVGMGTPIQTLQMSTAHLREVDIIGIFRYANTYPTGIKILSSGVLPSLDKMVTHRFSGLEGAKDAFELASRTKDDDGNLVLKVVIELNS